MSAIVLNEKMEKASELALPESFSGINPHNLYLYVKSTQAAMRANTASALTRAEVRGGGKKPWAQKGGGRGRAGSKRAPTFVGGGKAFGPKNNRNYDLKVNKKQKKLALNFALNQHAQNGSLFIVDSIEIASGKTRDAAAMFKSLNQRDTLFVKTVLDEKTYLAFENISSTYVIEENELNAYLAANYRSLVIEKAVWENLVGEAK
ncbi:MAG: 50S ribosomal protein L4 [Sulfurimonas sp. RIFCSPHIGHO2_12_FULL_36_9]|jgi:large subunit ribosomal protein L4|uniref:50S ribosomal protein L4 n=1 Tax=unclassified Sulfurimonas TaxID=2623549 RepID=UPI0008ABF305|nr:MULTISPECIES: 50S ribosomal protein L4 [unclassified Sulfurimonas]OHD97160.1 MAG: 50S ribosomal protein L4 [Sulfurimonas sp. RIFCSPLOWO2_02_FULL_36_28]OHD97640.1 MAG: 50S ribosomal protein L4 [Sulfurimonas sp. RIFCSPHIGHO2_12_FULL_36_9]OHE01731.1 MAG: 50S ribosomal protein L4 [Sulfurimonas sp. RIFCSPLOWO2_12_36_12]OHE08031.1 MAG: 50S ribosomal protein L4 [Sulfurimonas sp. RIFCSPLOWO2_12_FULL_36_74]